MNRTAKKLTSLLFAVMIVVGLMTAMSLTASAAEVSVSTPEQLAEAIYNAPEMTPTTIKLLRDIDGNESVSINDRIITIETNGYKLSTLTDWSTSYSHLTIHGDFYGELHADGDEVDGGSLTVYGNIYGSVQTRVTTFIYGNVIATEPSYYYNPTAVYAGDCTAYIDGNIFSTGTALYMYNPNLVTVTGNVTSTGDLKDWEFAIYGDRGKCVINGDVSGGIHVSGTNVSIKGDVYIDDDERDDISPFSVMLMASPDDVAVYVEYEGTAEIDGNIYAGDGIGIKALYDSKVTVGGSVFAGTPFISDDSSTITVNAQAHEHDFASTVTAPTCTEQGYTTYTCDCGEDSYDDDYIPALGHDFSVLIDSKAATAVEDGHITNKCSRCDETDTTVFPATGVVNEYTVSFNVDGNITRITVIEGEKVTPPSAPEKAGYIFTGWYAEGEAFDFNTVITGDITLTAVWMGEDSGEDGSDDEYADINGLLAALEKADPYLADYRKYTRTSFNALNKAVENGLKLAESYAATPLPTSSQAELNAAATAINYAVNNLKKASVLEQIINSALNFIDSHRARIVKSIALCKEKIARFMTCDISFNVDGNVTTQSVYRNRTVTKPAAPAKDGYTFDGWRVGSDSGAVYNFNSPVRRNLTLYASWVAIP